MLLQRSHLVFCRRVFFLAGGSIDLEYRELDGIAIKLPNGPDMVKAASHFRTVKGILSAEAGKKMQLYFEHKGLK